MTWVRYDDSFPIHRKVAPLDDATYRLHSEAIFWCSRNTTDGRIAADELHTISTRATVQRVGKLIGRNLWHAAGHECPSEKCPPPGADGWVIHDYLEYQPTKDRVKAELAAKAERTRLWRERKAGRRSRDGTGDASRDASSDVSSDVSSDAYGDASPSPPRPAPKEAGAGHPQHQPAAMGGAAGGPGEPNHRSSPPCRECGNSTTSAYHRNVCRGAA